LSKLRRHLKRSHRELLNELRDRHGPRRPAA
jgi:hypothetical protein